MASSCAKTAERPEPFVGQNTEEYQEFSKLLDERNVWDNGVNHTEEYATLMAEKRFCRPETTAKDMEGYLGISRPDGQEDAQGLLWVLSLVEAYCPSKVDLVFEAAENTDTELNP